MVFPVVLYGCESWISLQLIKINGKKKNFITHTHTHTQAEHQRIDAFEHLVLEKTPASPFGSKEIQPVSPKGNQSWIFIRRTDAEVPILWPSDVKSWLLGKDPDAGKDWRQEQKGMTEDEMVGWHHRLDGHQFEQLPGVGDGQGNLVCLSP